jgi:hypothetical protein
MRLVSRHKITMEAQIETTGPHAGEIGALLRGNAETLYAWNASTDNRRLALQTAIIIAGSGGYGAVMGCWRAPEQALFTAVKFPLIILLTTLGNALINGMLAPLLGLNIPFRQSFSAVVMSFAITSAIFGAFSPLVAFMVWNLPPMASGGAGTTAYNFMLLTHVLVIALAGTTGNVRLLQLLRKQAGDRATALRVLGAWLAGNFFLGTQLSWILRPFIGSPNLPLAFLRPDAFHGNFFEAVLNAAHRIFHFS